MPDPYNLFQKIYVSIATRQYTGHEQEICQIATYMAAQEALNKDKINQFTVAQHIDNIMTVIWDDEEAPPINPLLTIHEDDDETQLKQTLTDTIANQIRPVDEMWLIIPNPSEYMDSMSEGDFKLNFKYELEIAAKHNIPIKCYMMVIPKTPNTLEATTLKYLNRIATRLQISQ